MIRIELRGSTDHPAYRDLIKYPPECCSYEVRKLSRLPSLSGRYVDTLFLRKLYCKYKELFPLKPGEQVDLIHACDTWISARTNWVADFEHVGTLLGYSERLFKGWGSLAHRKIVERGLSSPHCKKLLAWSVAAKKSVLNLLDTSNFKNKLEVLYPAIYTVNVKKKRKNGKIRLLFVGRAFLSKGGRETLEAFKQLNKKYDVKLTMVSDVPQKYRVKHAYSNGLQIFSGVPNDKLIELYREADIFVLPTMMDTFGYVFLEAMNFCLPVVGLNIYSAVREIIEDGKTGFLIDPVFSMFNSNYLPKYMHRAELDEFIEGKKQLGVVKGLVEKLSTLIEDESLRRKMGREGKKKVEKGEFSIKKRNRRLKKIYEETMKK